MTSSKLVTSYYMDIREAPYFGATINRREIYLGSLISHSRIGIPIVCYKQE